MNRKRENDKTVRMKKKCLKNYKNNIVWVDMRWSFIRI